MTPTPAGNQSAVLETSASETKIEAVAGSGKTTTMVWRLQKEIEEHGQPPGRLLVLTFAREASDAIQEKLREELDPEQALKIDVANYHSFCYRLLQDYAYQRGLSPDFDLVTEESRSQVIESVYDRVDFSFVASGAPARGQQDPDALHMLTDFIERMRRESVSPAAIREYLPADETIRQLLALVNDLERAAERTVNVDTNNLMWNEMEIADGCTSLARVYCHQAREFSADDSFETTITNYLQTVAEAADNVAEHLRSTDDLQWQDYRLPEAMFQDESNRFPVVKQTLFGRFSAYVHMLRRARAYLDAYEAYLNELNERGALDYDELIHETVRLLEDERVRDDILAEWDMVFCDEFQDTDEAQLDLVDALRDELQIMVIGDSDQAIHEWRGQDPENMDHLPDSFDEIDLTLNFRSRQSILDVTNNLERQKQSIKAHREPNSPSVFMVDSKGKKTTEQVNTTVSRLLTDRFDDIDGVDLADIAVLVRRNAQARSVAERFDAAGIPYSLSSSTDDELDPGVRTVLSYLRILATPTDDVSWRRVLLLLYRVPENDVEQLLKNGESVPEGYDAVSSNDLERVERVDRAFEEYDELRSIATTHSISELYMRLKRETKIEWFLTEDDRDALGDIEQLISSFSDSPVRSRLTDEFVTYLERHAQQLGKTDQPATDHGSQSENAVDVMTVHQAKGLDFDTVLFPFLTEDKFGGGTLQNHQENLYRYDVLADSISDDLDEPLRGDFREAQIAEEWRILHVGLTRAKNRVFLFGNDTDGGKGAPTMIDQQLPREGSHPIKWFSEGPRMKVWEALEASCERIDPDGDAVRDYTDAVNRGIDEDASNITYYGTDISANKAIEKLLQAADQFVNGTLENDHSTTSDIDSASLGRDVSSSLARQHSHSALEKMRNCERRHVLDHVLEAFPDPHSTTPGSTGARHRAVGSLFHSVAELAYWREYTTVDEWKDACDWLARSDEAAAVADTKDCIETYFETDAAEWDAIGAEMSIELDEIDGIEGSVTGYIDSVREHPDGGLAVLDYKTGRTPNTIEESQQLVLYVRACQERFDAAVTHAGYVNVGEAGPDVQAFDASILEDYWSEVRQALEAADESKFSNASSGPHCKFCEHRSLGCSAANHRYSDEFRIEQR